MGRRRLDPHLGPAAFVGVSRSATEVGQHAARLRQANTDAACPLPSAGSPGWHPGT
jgi:hypothetical protein